MKLLAVACKTLMVEEKEDIVDWDSLSGGNLLKSTDKTKKLVKIL